jgi:DnaK suppressor protein
MSTKKAVATTVADDTTGKKSMPKKTATSKKTEQTATPVPQSSALDGFGKFTPYDEKAGEEYMSAAQIEHFRQILLAWRQELMEEVDRTVHHMQDEAANFPDPNDRATQESEFSMELRTRDRERKLLKKIDEALEALERGEYGFCESCGVEIGIRRLEARPTATLCIDCKTLDEIREKQRG